MTIKEYQNEALKTYKIENHKLKYLRLGLKGESGEVCDKIKKLIRDDDWNPGDPVPAERITPIVLELGDVMWYAVVYKFEFGLVKKHKSGYMDKELNDVESFVYTDLTEIAEQLSDACRAPIRSYEIFAYVATAAKCLGVDLETVCKRNVEKLSSRAARNKISGSGDER